MSVRGGGNKRPVAIIIGGGPAGLCAALSLSELCEHVHVVEKRQAFQPQGSAIVLKPNGQKALREVDQLLFEKVQEIGIELKIPGVPGLLLPWWCLRDAILERVQKCPNVELHMGEHLERIEENKGTLAVLLENGSKLYGDFLLGADGVHSQVRQLLGLPPGIESGSVCFRGHARIDERSSPLLRELLDRGTLPHPHRLFGNTFFSSFNYNSKIPGLVSWVVPTREKIPLDGSVTPLDLINNYLETRKRKSNAKMNCDDDDWPVIRELLEASDPESFIPFPPAKIMDLSDATLGSYDGGWGGKGGITLIGDAAHAMNPTDGQGGSQAFEDVVVLKRLLLQYYSCQYKDKNTTVSQVMQLFEKTRLPRVKRIYDDQKMRLEMRYRGETEEPYSEEYRHWLEAGV